MHNSIFALVSVVVLLGVLACSPRLPSAPPSIRGTITHRFGEADPIWRLQVDEDPNDPVMSGRDTPKAEVSVSSETHVLRRAPDGSLQKTRRATLAVGCVVSIWYDPRYGTQDTYPELAAAGFIVLESCPRGA